jgi:hypothetical protein
MSSFPGTHRWLRRRRHGANPLLEVPSFRDADPRRLAELAPHSDRLRLQPARTLVRAGDMARELIVILAGEATVLHQDGGVDVLRAGDEIGGREVLRNDRHAATVVAASPVEVVVLNGPAVRWAHQEGVGRLSRPVGRTSPAPVRLPGADRQVRLAG